MRRHGIGAKASFRPLTMTMWRDEREAPETTLRGLQTKLREAGALPKAGGDYDGWDLEVSGGLFGGSRLLLAVEEHAPGKQLLRYRVTPTYYRTLIAVAVPFIAMSITAALSKDWIGSAASGLVAALVCVRAVTDAGLASGILRDLLTLSGAS